MASNLCVRTDGTTLCDLPAWRSRATIRPIRLATDGNRLVSVTTARASTTTFDVYLQTL